MKPRRVKPKGEPVAEKTMVKKPYRDRQHYIRVPGDHPAYLVAFYEDGKRIGERVVTPKEKCVKSKGKKYCYKYIVVPQPWSSVLQRATGKRGTHVLDVKVYPATLRDLQLYQWAMWTDTSRCRGPDRYSVYCQHYYQWFTGGRRVYRRRKQKREAKRFTPESAEEFLLETPMDEIWGPGAGGFWDNL